MCTLKIFRNSNSDIINAYVDADNNVKRVVVENGETMNLYCENGIPHSVKTVKNEIVAITTNDNYQLGSKAYYGFKLVKERKYTEEQFAQLIKM